MKQARTTSLVALCASLPMFAWGLTPMNENQLAGVSGRDGVTVTVTLPTAGLSWDQTIYDRDGVPGDGSVLGIPTSLAPNSGSALVMKGIGLTATGSMTIAVDTGQAAGKPVLNINVAIPDGTQLHLPDLQLAKPTTAGGWALDAATTKTVLSAGTTLNPGITVVLGATNLNLQLGNVAQTMQVTKPTSPTTTTTVTYKPLLLTDLSIKNGIHIQNMTITDVSDPNSATYKACLNGATKVDCAQTIGDIYINDNSGTLAATKGSSNLTLKKFGMSVTQTGVAFAVEQLGYRDGSNVDHGINVQMDNIHLGDSSLPGLGNAYLKGLQLGNDAILTISGH